MQIMTLRTKIILVIIAAITAIATLFAAAYKPKRTEIIGNPLVKIKAVLPLSGPEAYLGENIKKTFEYLLKQTQQNPTRYRYELLFEDSAAPNQFEENAQVTIKYNQNPEPQININVPSQENPTYTIHTSYMSALEKFIENLPSYNAQNIGLIIQASGNYRELANLLKENIPNQYALNGAIFQEGQQNFSNIINLLRNNDTDLFVIIGAPTETDKLTEQLHHNGISNYQISSLYTFDLTQNLQLYENARYIGTKGGNLNTRMAFETLKILILAYEKSYIKDKLPPQESIIKQLDLLSSNTKEINIPAAIKVIINGNISELTE